MILHPCFNKNIFFDGNVSDICFFNNIPKNQHHFNTLPLQFQHTISFLLRIGVALSAFTCCRLLFLGFNFSSFSDVSFLHFLYALRFDISAITFLYLPFIVFSIIPFHAKGHPSYQLFLKILFHGSNTVSLLFNCVDIEYFKFSLKRTTSEIFNIIGIGEDFLTLLPKYAIDFWHVPVLCIAMVTVTGYLYNLTNGVFPPARPISRNILKFYFYDSFLFILLTALFIIAGRGGLQLRPIDIINANEYASPRNVPLVLNTPFTIIKTFFEEGIKEQAYFPKNRLAEIYSPLHHYSNKERRVKNVVLIIMESFSNEYMGVMKPEIKRETFTPFLDSLARHSLVFDRCFANGKKSIEGIPAIVASLPALMNNPFISSAYSANKINGLAALLKGEGFSTGFFHGGTNGTMGFDAFAHAAGFERYSGRREYNNEAHYDGHWGIFDEEFFDYFNQSIRTFREPFFGCFFSLSSHHPYTIPGKYRHFFRDGKLKIHKSISYADFSLGKFFEAASKEDWFERTLFVVTADHTSTTSLPFFNNAAGIYSIPLLFYCPGTITPAINHRVTQQTDILPSILDFLGYNKEFVAFGQSVFSDSAGFSVSAVNDLYQLITDEYTLQMSGNQLIRLYDFKNDPLLKNNILADSSKAESQKQKLKAIIQSYNYRMINNRLTIR